MLFRQVDTQAFRKVGGVLPCHGVSTGDRYMIETYTPYFKNDSRVTGNRVPGVPGRLEQVAGIIDVCILNERSVEPWPCNSGFPLSAARLLNMQTLIGQGLAGLVTFVAQVVQHGLTVSRRHPVSSVNTPGFAERVEKVSEGVSGTVC